LTLFHRLIRVLVAGSASRAPSHRPRASGWNGRDEKPADANGRGPERGAVGSASGPERVRSRWGPVPGGGNTPPAERNTPAGAPPEREPSHGLVAARRGGDRTDTPFGAGRDGTFTGRWVAQAAVWTEWVGSEPERRNRNGRFVGRSGGVAVEGSRKRRGGGHRPGACWKWYPSPCLDARR
jgi:hypothetical protein